MDTEANRKQFFLKQPHVLYDTLMYKKEYQKMLGNIFTFGGEMDLVSCEVTCKKSKQQKQNITALHIKIGIFKVKKCRWRSLDLKRFYIIIAMKEKTM